MQKKRNYKMKGFEIKLSVSDDCKKRKDVYSFHVEYYFRYMQETNMIGLITEKQDIFYLIAKASFGSVSKGIRFTSLFHRRKNCPIKLFLILFKKLIFQSRLFLKKWG